MLKFYQYSGCGTCRKAKKYLEANDIGFKDIPIRETPPSKAELKRMLKVYDGELKRLFNTAGQDYRALKIKDKIKTISTAEAIDLLAGNGNLIKRPFVIDGERGLVGFKEDEWAAFFS